MKAPLLTLAAIAEVGLAALTLGTHSGWQHKSYSPYKSPTKPNNRAQNRATNKARRKAKQVARRLK